MKTFRLLFFLVVVTAISATFISCGGDDNPTPPSNNPTITITPTTQSINVDRYQDITFNITCTQNSTTKKALSKLKIVAKYTPAGSVPGGTETLVDTPALAADHFSYNYIYTVSASAPYN
jgi:hypothetical protein